MATRALSPLPLAAVESVPLAAVELRRALAEKIRPVALAEARLLPLLPELGALVPHAGLSRGSTIAVSSAALTLLALASATQAGSWAAVVGRPEIGWAAAAELGVDIDRVGVVTVPLSSPSGCSLPTQHEAAVTVLAALVDAVDLVVVGSPVIKALRPLDVRRLVARARERGAVLLLAGEWGEPVDQRWRVVGTRCEGLGAGWGHLRSWQVEVRVDGRGAASRPRQGWVTMYRGETFTDPVEFDDPVISGPDSSRAGSAPAATARPVVRQGKEVRAG